ncbi:MAG: transporter substrate-binding domain-containing protein [Desulfatibacillum sp.]|nr:transporter substrate-binding domain-containing protein [Desulfatibacillum sp.]
MARGDRAYPPYEYLQNGKPTGFNIEILEAVCKIMGYRPEIDIGPWNEVREDLEKGRIDMITGMYFSPERDKIVDFSSPHIIVNHGVFVKKGSPIRSINDIRDKRVAVQEGDIMHDYALKNGLGKPVLTAPDQIDVLRLVAEGKADCALMPKLQGLYYARKEKLRNIVTVGPPILPREYCFAVREGDTDLLAGLNEGLSILKATGEFERIHQKWFGVYEREPAAATIRKYVLWVAMPLLLLLALSYLWSRSLKRQVAIQTHALIVSEQRFSGLLDRLNEAVFHMELPEGRYRYFSPAALQVFGYSAREFLDTPLLIRKILHPDWLPQFDEAWSSLLEGKVAPSYEYGIIDPKGRERWIFQTNTGVYDENGNIIAIEGCCSNISDRKRTENMVQDHLSFFKNVSRVEQELAGTPDLEETLEKVLEVVLDIFDCDRAWLLYPCDPEAATFKVHMETSTPEFAVPSLREHDFPMTPGLVRAFRDILDSREPAPFGFRPGKVEWDPRNRYNVLSLLAVAVFPKVGKPWIFGLHQCAYSRIWTQWEKSLFKEIGLRLAEALNSLLLFRDLEQREEMFRAITENASDVTGILARDLTFKYICPSSIRVSGFGEEQFLGQSLDKFVHPDDLPEFLEAIAASREQEGKTFVLNGIRMLNGDGSYTHFEILVVCLLSTPGVKGIVLTGRDLTIRREAEIEMNRLRRLLTDIINSMPSVLVGIDAQGRITHWNRGAEQFTGIDEASVLSMELEQALSHIVSLCEKVRESQEKGEPLREVNVPVKVLGEQRFVDITIYPLTSEDQGGAVIRMDDVTEQVRIEEMMIQSEKMLSVGGLAAGMAHEINNPLAGILQNAEVVINRLSENLPANMKSAMDLGLSMDGIRAYMDARGIFTLLGNIRDSGQRAASIVDNMLGFSRKTESLFLAHDLVSLMEKTLDLASSDYDLKKDYDFKRIEIVREYDDNLPLVECDAVNIQQVLLNLLKNGAAAMSEKEYDGDRPKFVLRLRQEGEMVRLEVEDNGVGMPKDVRKRAFEPFYTTKAVGQGTGLGLSVSYFIVVEKHKGRMGVESRPGQGSTFVVQLPIHMVKESL